MTYGLKISQAGFDVGTAANKNLIFTTDGSSMKIVSTGTININIPSTLGVLTVGTVATHGLSFIPAFVAFAQLGVGTNYWAHNIIGVPPETDYHHFWAYADGTNINLVMGKNLQASDAGSTCTHKIVYFLFSDPIT